MQQVGQTTIQMVESCFDRIRRADVSLSALAQLRHMSLSSSEVLGGVVDVPVALYRDGRNFPIQWAIEPGMVFSVGATEVGWTAGELSGTLIVVVSSGANLAVGSIRQEDLCGRQEVNTRALDLRSLRLVLERRSLDGAKAHRDLYQLCSRLVSGTLRRHQARMDALVTFSKEDAGQEAQLAIFKTAVRFSGPSRPNASWWAAAQLAVDKTVQRAADAAGGHSEEVGRIRAVIDRLQSDLARDPSYEEVQLELSRPASDASLRLAFSRPWVTRSLDESIDPAEEDSYLSASEEEWCAGSAPQVSWGLLLLAVHRKGWLPPAPSDDQAVVVLCAAERGHVGLATVVGRILDPRRRLSHRRPANDGMLRALWMSDTQRSWQRLADLLADGPQISGRLVMEAVGGDKTHLLDKMDHIAGVKRPLPPLALPTVARRVPHPNLQDLPSAGGPQRHDATGRRRHRVAPGSSESLAE